MARLRLPQSLLSVARHLRPPPGIPLPALWLIGLLVTVNALVWAAAAVVLRFFPGLVSSAVLAYTFGLRHALDADHITAIDLATRRLIADGRRPVAVGTFFSLGHSTIVIITCVVVAATAGALRDRFDAFQRIGGLIGTSVSAAVLLILGAANAWLLCRLVVSLRAALAGAESEGPSPSENLGPAAVDDTNAAAANTGARHLDLDSAGLAARVFRRLFRIVDRPWKMFPLGLLFGLGFDTSSEIAVLGIASIEGAKGTSIWVILIFPILFTAGMCLVDTADGALMMALYTSKAFSRDPVAILYYSIVLTAITVAVSAFIGAIQVLSLIQNAAEPSGRFWDGVGAIGDHYDIVGGVICGVFLLTGLASVLAYRPWRRRMDARSRNRASDTEEMNPAGMNP